MAYPISVTFNRPENLSRLHLLARTFLGLFYVFIPHGLILFVLGIIAFFGMFIAFFAVLFTGKYPKGIFNFIVGYMRWRMRVMAYMLFLTEKYPPFSLQKGDHDVNLEVDYPENLSRGLLLIRVFLGWLYIFIPHGVVLYFRMICDFILIIIAWFIVLFTGQYPEPIYNFVSGTIRWQFKLTGYTLFMTDEYPPFSGKE